MHAFLSPLRSTLLLLALVSLLGCNAAQSPTHSLEVAAVGLHSAALSNDGKRVVIGSIYHGGSYWLLDSEQRIYNWNHDDGGPTTITSTALANDSAFAITANPATLVLWQTDTGKALRYWTAPGEILDIALGPNANTALLGLNDHSAVLFDVQRGGILQRFKHANRVRSVDLSENGQLALTGSEDYSVSLWDTRNGEQRLRLKHNDDVQLVRLSPDGTLALSVSKYDKAMIWRTADGSILGELPLKAEHIKRGTMFTCARFDRNNQHLLTGRPDQIVQLWQLPELKEIGRWQLPKRHRWKPSSAAVLDVSFAHEPQGFYAVASNGFVHWLHLDKQP